jgi:hypothetical protein
MFVLLARKMCHVLSPLPRKPYYKIDRRYQNRISYYMEHLFCWLPISNYLVFDWQHPTANRQFWWLWTGSVIFIFFRKIKRQLHSCCSANSLACAWISWLDFITLSCSFFIIGRHPTVSKILFFFQLPNASRHFFFWTIVINGMHCLLTSVGDSLTLHPNLILNGFLTLYREPSP